MQEEKATRREFLKGVSTPVVLSSGWFSDDDEEGFWESWFGDDEDDGDVTVYGGQSSEKGDVSPDGKGLYFAYDEDAWYKQTSDESEWKLSTIGGGGSSNWELDGNGNLTPKDNEPISVDEILNVADHIVSTTSELESAFNNPSAGDVVYIGRPATPYRTTQWLDIDTDGMTVIGQSRFAEDGQPLIKVADGANVGGIRVGHNSPVSDVTLRNLGYHGNDLNQDQTVKRLHGFVIDDATDVVATDLFATRTSPYNEHGTGGSGITVRHAAQRVTLERLFVDDIGDRGVQVSGTDISIDTVKSINGFDRAVSFDVYEADGSEYGAHAVTAQNIFGRNHSNGSIVGMGSATGSHANTPNGNISVDTVVARGTHRRAVSVDHSDAGTDFSGLRFRNIDGDGGSYEGVRLGGSVEDVELANVSVRNYSGHGVRFDAGTGRLSNIYVYNAGNHGILFDTMGKITGSSILIDETAGDGIANTNTGLLSLSDIVINFAGDHGIDIPNTGQPQQYENVNIKDSNQNASGSVDVNLNGTENRITGTWGTESLGGTRCVYNGRSHQSATPGSGNTGDDWGGNEGLAYRLDVTVEDRSVATPYSQYKVDSAGNWVQIA